MFEIFLYIVFFVLVIAGAYYTTKWISKKTVVPQKGKTLKILDRVYVDRDKYIILLEKNDTAYIIGMTNQNITLIDTFSSSEIPVQQQEAVNEGSFRKNFSDILQKFLRGGDKGE